MDYILLVLVMGASGNVSSGLATSSQQIKFANKEACEVAKAEVDEMRYRHGVTGLGTTIGNFEVRSACLKYHIVKGK